MAKASHKVNPKPDDVETFDFPQRSPEWFEVRRGIPTASRFATIMADGKDGEDSKTRSKLLNQMAGEILTGEVAETFRNEAMDRGIEMEPRARERYARATFEEMAQPGFVRRTIHDPLRPKDPLVIGCSPDSFVGADGLLEIKTMRPDLMIPIIRKGAAGLPTRHRAQCMGSLWVTGRLWCDLVIYYDGMPQMPRFRITRNAAAIAEIRNAVEIFNYELWQAVNDVRSRGA